jgi:hypothetical protein
MAMGAYGCMDLGGWDNMDIDLCADVYDVGMAQVQASSLQFDIDEEVVGVHLI